MPTATQQESQQEVKEEAPDLVSKVPAGLKKKREGEVVYSRSRRQALGGQVTHGLPDAGWQAPGGGSQRRVPGEFAKFTGKGQALDVARSGPAEVEPEEEQEKAEAA
jgi:hypothetical protein